MRRWRAIVFATAQEILGEPFVLLVLLASLALASLAPAMHYHQFGESSRMARDAGLSAILLGGAVVAFTGGVRTFRREIETGTAQAALAHPVSRTEFFIAKTIGCMTAYAMFSLTLFLVSTTVVRGAEIGAAVASVRGDMPRLWGPSLALAVGAIVLPVVVAAALNRFARWRFTISANILALAFAAVGVAYRFDASLAMRLAPVFLLAAAPSLVLLSAAAAFSVRFGANMAAACVAVVAALLLPALGNYCLSDALADGGSLPWLYALSALAALLPAVAALLLVGTHFINKRDLQ